MGILNSDNSSLTGWFVAVAGIVAITALWMSSTEPDYVVLEYNNPDSTTNKTVIVEDNLEKDGEDIITFFDNGRDSTVVVVNSNRDSVDVAVGEFLNSDDGFASFPSLEELK